MRYSLAIGLSAAVLGCLSLTSQAQTTGAYIQDQGSGQINWTQKYIEVEGAAVAPAGTPAGQARLLAQRAAKAVAYRNLLEIVQGVQVDAETTVRDFVTESDVIRTRVSGVVKGARQMGKTRFMSDGTVAMTLRMPLFGQLAQAVNLQQVVGKQQQRARQMSYFCPPRLAAGPEALSWASYQLARCQRTDPSLETPTQSPQPSAEPTPEPTAMPTAPPVEAAPMSSGATLMAPNPDQAFTGLVVDARGLNLTPSMSPMVRAAQSQVYVGNFELDIDRVISEGIVLYFKSMDEALKSRRAGAHPIVVKAVQTDKHRVDFVIQPEDASAIQRYDQRDQFLKNLQVVAVL